MDWGSLHGKGQRERCDVRVLLIQNNCCKHHTSGIRIASTWTNIGSQACTGKWDKQWDAPGHAPETCCILTIKEESKIFSFLFGSIQLCSRRPLHNVRMQESSCYGSWQRRSMSRWQTQVVVNIIIVKRTRVPCGTKHKGGLMTTLNIVTFNYLLVISVAHLG